ncbi:TIGR03773 family transporter-associated surface protein [Plantactinospora sp. KBS50]|uniref:TIGR03773 family transporter-associated surface protein n=1 Tax=Plantactinospora sp. KBS50 TaxID=2024580 RepID=UPI001E44343F|nr:TIGR03773 family transporter-associated surface protein [Plantactinospora sp. KBS50]
MGPGSPPAPADGLAQTLEANQPQAEGNAVLASGHVDIGPRYRDGNWTVQIHDDSVLPAVWRQPTATVLRVRDSARQQVPDDPAYDFLGAQPGTGVYVVPQTQQPDVVWIGWNTQDPGVLAAIDRGVTLSLRGVQGPGRLTVHLQSGNLGAPQVLWDSAGAYPQPIWVETNTHTHANWVFGEPGIYLLAVTLSADLADGSTVSGDAVLRFAVGDATAPDRALAAAFTAPVASGPAPARPAAHDPRDTDDGSPVPLLVGAAGGAVVVVLVVALGLRGMAARRRAEREHGATR